MTSVKRINSLKMGNMQTTIEKDGDGYLAKVKDQPNVFAFAYSEKEAVQEL